MKRRISVLLGIFLPLSGCSLSWAGGGTVPYSTLLQTLDPMGYAHAGALLADVDHDGVVEMLLSNGLEMSPQPFVFYQALVPSTNGVGFVTRPSWYSGDIWYAGRLEAGYLGQDAFLDVVVPVVMGRDLIQAGRVLVFLNQRDDPNREPVQEIRGAGTPDDPVFATEAVSLADINGDGYLDMAVAPLLDGQAVWPPSSGESVGGRPRVYMGKSGKRPFEAAPSWRADAPLTAGAILWADVDLDGAMDLIVGANGVSVYFGSWAGGDYQLSTQPGWVSAIQPQFVASLDVARLSDGAQTVLAGMTAYNGLISPERQWSLAAFQPAIGASTAPVWQSNEKAWWGGLTLVDYDADLDLDLVAGAWFEWKVDHAPPIRIYENQNGQLNTSPIYTSQSYIMVNDIAAGPLPLGSDYPLISRNEVYTLSSGNVLTLAGTPVSIDRIQCNGKLLNPGQWHYVPTQRSISLHTKTCENTCVDIHYQWDPTPSLAIAGQMASDQSGGLFGSAGPALMTYLGPPVTVQPPLQQCPE